MTDLEGMILSNLLFDEPYLRKVLPFIKEEYFKDTSVRSIFKKVVEFIEQYNVLPSVEALHIQLQNDSKLDESEYSSVSEILDGLKPTPETNREWMIDATEKYCKDRALHLALIQSVEIVNGSNNKLTPDAIPSILTDALSVCFDSKVGMDYSESAEERFEYYNDDSERIACDLEMFNKITNGGIPRKTLNIIQGGIHTGKTLILCHLAAAYQEAGYNVLYITLEMSEQQISARLDSNILHIPIGDLSKISHEKYMEKMAKFKKGTVGKSPGKLIIKEYPTGSGHVGHFRALLSELKMKKGFVADVICVDYLNICASSRIKNNGTVNSYTLVKSIAEELRGLAMERDLIAWSATQLTRSGSEKSDPGMTDASESFGVPATSDFYLSVVNNEELAKLNQLMVIQNKNRYRNFMSDHRFMIGVDTNYMKLYDSDFPTKNLMNDSHSITIPASEVPTITPYILKNRDYKDIKV